MLIGARVFLGSRGMKPALMGKGGLAHIRGMGIWQTVQAFIYRMGQAGQACQFFCRNIGHKPHFQHQIWNKGNQIGISAPLAQAVNCALYMARACPNSSQRISNRHAGIIMTMNTQPAFRYRLFGGCDNIEYFFWQAAAIGIA